MIKEFKDFIARGNVIDMAVGIIVGAAFTAIVKSLVDDLINPLIGIFIGKIDLSNLVLEVGNATFKCGSFINAVINFLIIAFVVFLLVKGINKFRSAKEEETEETPEEPSEEVQYLKEIAGLLKERQGQTDREGES